MKTKISEIFMRLPGKKYTGGKKQRKKPVRKNTEDFLISLFNERKNAKGMSEYVR
jgi:hypothetical protein